MSLTFDFPQWQLRVTNSRTQDASNTNPDNVAGPASDADWAADLAELDGGDETCDAEVQPAVTENTDHVDQRVSDRLVRRHDAALAMDSVASASKDATAYSSNCHHALSCAHVGGNGGGGNRDGTPLSLASAELAAISRTTGTNIPDGTAATGSQAAAHVRTSPVTISGDSIPAEVLLLVLSGLRDVGDCVRAALVCRHWLSVVTLSNELWCELEAIQLQGGTWRRAPHAGCPLLRPPPGCDHPQSKMLSYKTTCALTLVAVRFMVLRKGFEYVVEAAASLWLAACRAAAEAGGQQHCNNNIHNMHSTHNYQQQGPLPLSPPPQQQQLLPQYQVLGPHQGSSPQAAPLTQAVAGSRNDRVTWSGGAGATPRATAESLSAAPAAGLDVVDSDGPNGRRQREDQQQQQQDEGSTRCGFGRDSDNKMEEGLQQGKGSRVAEEDSSPATAAALAVGMGGSPSGACKSSGGISGSDGSGAASTSWLGAAGRQRGRITHVDQLWETCGRSRAALQVDERFNAVRVQQMVVKLCCSGGALWLSLYEGVAAVMASRCDQIRDQLTAAAAVAAATRDAASAADCTSTCNQSAEGQGPKRRRGLSLGDRSSGGGSGQPVLRGDVVYGGSSYADRFAELLRRGDTRGALALGAPPRTAGGTGGEKSCGDGDGTSRSGGGGGGAIHWELDEPEMREVVLMVEAVPEPPAIVAEGLLLWRLLLSSWPVYRRWLEVWVVWCGPLGARVEAERQLASAAAAHGEAPLAPPHLTNKGLLLFRSQVLLAYPLRRPLQAAALWLLAKADQGEEGGRGSTVGGGSGGLGGSSFAGSRGDVGGCGAAGGCGGNGADRAGLSEEHGQLLTAIRKLLTEVAVSDDATQPPHLHTRLKLQRCFGSCILRPVPGGTRALQMAQRLQGLREAVTAGGGGGGGSSW